MTVRVIVLISFKQREKERQREREREGGGENLTRTHTRTQILSHIYCKKCYIKQVLLKKTVMVLMVQHLPVQVVSDSLKYPSVHISHLPSSVVHFPQF